MTCPDGEDSWCWYKKDIVRGISRPIRPDGQQSTYLSKDVAKQVKEHLWSGYKRVFMAVTLAVVEFNMGSKGLQEFLKACGCTVHETSVLLGRRRDKRRLKSADEVEKSVQKRKREARCLNASRTQQAMEEKEELTFC
ncbi:hypothetical protein Btru_030108 [Bulinus truncatus]|nr:hypothetical protein Btru_030108 [Bulinus truncatus]